MYSYMFSLRIQSSYCSQVVCKDLMKQKMILSWKESIIIEKFATSNAMEDKWSLLFIDNKETHIKSLLFIVF